MPIQFHITNMVAGFILGAILGHFNVSPKTFKYWLIVVPTMIVIGIIAGLVFKPH